MPLLRAIALDEANP
jgi:hypothetical protein